MTENNSVIGWRAFTNNLRKFLLNLRRNITNHVRQQVNVFPALRTRGPRAIQDRETPFLPSKTLRQVQVRWTPSLSSTWAKGYGSLINLEAGLVAVTYTFRWDPTQRRDGFFLTGRPDYCRLHLLVRRDMSWICIGSFWNLQVHDWSSSIPRELRGILSLGCLFAYLHSGDWTWNMQLRYIWMAEPDGMEAIQSMVNYALTMSVLEEWWNLATEKGARSANNQC